MDGLGSAVHAHATTLRPNKFVNGRSSVQSGCRLHSCSRDPCRPADGASLRSPPVGLFARTARDARTIAGVRRSLRPEDLGDLLERPFNAIVGIHRIDGSILLTPVWHLFRDGAFWFQIPGGDRKIQMLERDARVSLIVAEDDLPYRAIEASGRARVSSDGYDEIGRAIVGRYVEAHDPGADLADYLLEGGVIVRLEPDAIRAWDYSDAAFVQP